MLVRRFCVLAGVSWALIERFGEVPGEASGAPGEANLGDERGDWDI